MGANNGDSIINFFGIKNKQLFNGIELPKMIDINLINQVSWIVYAFEPNPIFDKKLNDIKINFPKQHKLHLYNGTAGWVYDGTIDFFIELDKGRKHLSSR